MIRVGGVKHTIRQGVIYDSKKLLSEVKEMVKKAKNKEDFKSYQTFKIITSRSFSKRASFSAPNLDDCASDEFCMESWLNDN